MNVLILSTQNPYITSGIVAYNLYKGIKSKGHNAKVLIRYYGKYDEADLMSMETRFDVVKERIKNKFKRLMDRFPRLSNKVKTDPEYHVQDFDQTREYYSTKKLLRRINFKPDAIIYLFQQNFLTAKNLFELNKITGAPIFWYLMDTAPLTGLCHYSWDCTGFTKGCGSCPALYSKDNNDQSAKNYQYKLKYLSNININIIAPTEWQKVKATESLLFKSQSIHKILLSIDSKVFDFTPKPLGKKNLGIPDNKRVIFFGSTSVHHKRKGMRYLIEALEILKNEYNTLDGILLLTAGNFDSTTASFPFESKNLGLLINSEQLASAYHAADVFVCPSIEDSGPLMINQSIMTGTPVVSFEMGVSEDLVLTGRTGYRAELMDSHDLAKGINYVLSLSIEEHQQMCVNSRNLALSNYSFEVATEKIIEIIQMNVPS